jgi:hypothetical protein
MFVTQSVGKTLALVKSQNTFKQQKKRISVTPSLLGYSMADEISLYHRGQGLCSSQCQSAISGGQSGIWDSDFSDL